VLLNVLALLLPNSNKLNSLTAVCCRYVEIVDCVGDYGRVHPLEPAEDIFEGNLLVIFKVFVGLDLGTVLRLKMVDKESNNIGDRWGEEVHREHCWPYGSDEVIYVAGSRDLMNNLN